ncbi:thioesterase family protein [Candidatus Methanoplasma termitum]|nr:thioesterase family protein [Candidatus Methanoplasma termitum]MCL2333256.1 thioesterase family protein [Candidatus Methanoplasma sp.]
MISVGITNEASMTVTKDNTALALVSGAIDVFATPAMISLIEKTATECLQQRLSEGESSVGTYLEIKHSAPSVIGSEVFCKVEITEIDRSRIVFDVKVWDAAGEVGSGRHDRFLVNKERFMKKAVARAEKTTHSALR